MPGMNPYTPQPFAGGQPMGAGHGMVNTGGIGFQKPVQGIGRVGWYGQGPGGAPRGGAPTMPPGGGMGGPGGGGGFPGGPGGPADMPDSGEMNRMAQPVGQIPFGPPSPQQSGAPRMGMMGGIPQPGFQALQQPTGAAPGMPQGRQFSPRPGGPGSPSKRDAFNPYSSR